MGGSKINTQNSYLFSKNRTCDTILRNNDYRASVEWFSKQRCLQPSLMA